MSRRRDSSGRQALAFSLLLHGGIVGFGWMSTLHEPEVIEFISYQVELVSPAPALQAEEATPAAEELVVETPEMEPEPVPEAEPAPRPEPEPDPTPPPEPEPREQPRPEPPRPAPPAPPVEERPPETREEPRPATTTEAPAEEATESGEGINVRLEGVRRDYPAYYENIIRQIHRCFRWRGGGSWETVVRFSIRRDGSVTDLQFVDRSGNAGFDFEAMGAVDCAGQGRFGPLPDDLPYERLPIQFSFRPTGR